MKNKYIKLLLTTSMSSKYYFGSLTRIADLDKRSFTIDKAPRSIWATGDYVVGRYVGDTEGQGGEVCLELGDGTLQLLKLGDIVVGAIGDRRATFEVVGSWQLIDEASHPISMDMICGSGLFGIETSRCSRHPPSAKFVYEGHCLRLGKKVCMKDFGPIEENATEMPHCPIILIVGSSMSSGKTFTGQAIIKIIKKDLGLEKVAAVKFTGAGYKNDIKQFSEAGADFAVDFVDAGYPSTVMPAEDYRELVLPVMLGVLAKMNPDCIVAEVGASPFEAYNGVEVLKELLVSDRRPSRVHVVMCASDAYAALGLRQVLVSEGLVKFQPDILGVSGWAASNAAAAALVKRVSGLQAFNFEDPASVERLRMLLEKRLLS